MREIFYPTTVAVIGVSAKPDNLGRNIVGNLVEYGFDGIVYAVGPSGGTIETRRIYKSVGDIPDHIDLAVILTPAVTVPVVLEECGQKGIRRAIIETAGFREYAESGRQLEDEIQQVAVKYQMRFIGPNCIGAINMENGFCVPFPRLKKFVKRGEVSVISQSGGVGMAVLNLMANEGLGLNKFVSVGNTLNIGSEELLEYLIEDEGTRLIFIYLESIQDGRRLMEVARTSHKPVMVFKSNIGRLGQNIALSHTASLASDDKVVDAAFHQAGILRVRDATTLGNNLKILGLQPMKGKNLGIISRSGGQAVIAADACEISGFNLAHFPDSFLRDIEKHFRASVIKLTNPLDLGDLFDLELYAQIVKQTLQLPDVDGIVFLQTSLSETENLASRQLLERIIKLVEEYQKPVAYYISTMASEVTYLKQNYNFPIFTQVVETVRALEMSHYYYQQYQQVHDREEIPKLKVNRTTVRAILEKAQEEGRNLSLAESLNVLENYGIPTTSGLKAASRTEAVNAANELGYPLAMKILSEQISHKSDAGGVRLNLQDENQVGRAYDQMLDHIRLNFPQVQLDGVLLQPMIASGKELILGGRQDPQFGPVIVLGMGGIFVEILEQVAMRVAPITMSDAWEMIDGLRGAQILSGVRGEQPSDKKALVEALLRLSQLLVDFPQIQELDINPLRVFYVNEGCRALDARIILEK